MLAVSGAGALTRSAIESWDVEHLETAATHFSSTAQVWEEHYTAIHHETVNPGGTVWDGVAAEAAQESTFADLVKVRGTADGLYSASTTASEGASELAWAKRRVLEAIEEAEAAGFTVEQDLSVRDQSGRIFMRDYQARQAQAQMFAAEIGSHAQTLTTIDKEVAGKITTALAPVRGLSFGESGGETAPVVQAAGYGFKRDMQDGDHDPYTGADNHKPQVKTPLPPQYDPNTGAAQGPGGNPLEKYLEGEIEAPVAAGLPATTADSVATKLDTYLLNPAHPDGAAKARWFQQALGFTRANAGDLGRQITFDPAKAVETAVNQYGTKYNEVIPIVGANGKTIDVLFAFIRNNDGIVRLVTAIPTRQ